MNSMTETIRSTPMATRPFALGRDNMWQAQQNLRIPAEPFQIRAGGPRE